MDRFLRGRRCCAPSKRACRRQPRSHSQVSERTVVVAKPVDRLEAHQDRDSAERRVSVPYGAYSLAWDESGKRATDKGKNVEIWKKQPNGHWKCVVDTWNSDLTPTPLHLTQATMPDPIVMSH